MDSLKLKGGVRRKTSKTSKRTSKKTVGGARKYSKKTSRKTSKTYKRTSKKMSGGAKRHSRRKVSNKMIGGGPTTIKSKDPSGKDVSYTIKHGGRFKRGLIGFDKIRITDNFGSFGPKNSGALSKAWDIFEKYSFAPGPAKTVYKELNDAYKQLGCKKETNIIPFDLYEAVRKLDIFFNVLAEADTKTNRKAEPQHSQCPMYEPADVNDYDRLQRKPASPNIYDKLLRPEDHIYEEIGSIKALVERTPGGYESVKKKYIHKQRKL